MPKTSNYDQEYLDANVEIYYPDCVGVCYVPIYPNLFDNPVYRPDWFLEIENQEAEFTPPPDFSGTNSHGAIWLYYTPSDIESQLTSLKNVGFNCVRLWTNYFMWNLFERLGQEYDFAGNPMLDNLQHFLGYCDQIGMNVGICLFEHFSTTTDTEDSEPDTSSGTFIYTTPIYQVDIWRRSPGSDNETVAFLTSGIGSEFLDGSAYVTAVIDVCKDYQCITTYDILDAANENLSEDFIKLTADIIRATDPDPSHKVFVNSEGLTPFPDSNPLHNPCSDYSSIDLLTTHPFFITRRSWNEFMNIAFSACIQAGKPFYGTECGFPGGFQRYEKMVEYSKDRGQKGVGFTFWQAMCGHPKGNEAFGTGGGFLHYDGNVRDWLACKAIYDRAVELGQARGQLSLPLELPEDAYADTNFDGEEYGVGTGRRVSDQYLAYPGNPFYPSLSGPAYENWIADRYGPDEVIQEIMNYENRVKIADASSISDALDYYSRYREILTNFYLEFRTPFSDTFLKTVGTEFESGILSGTVDAGRYGNTAAYSAIDLFASALSVSGITECLAAPYNGTTCLYSAASEPADLAGYDTFFDEWFSTYKQILEDLEWTDNST